MNADQFIDQFPGILDEIGQVADGPLAEAVEQLRTIEPADLISKHDYFENRDHALGFVFRSIILRTHFKTLRHE